MYQFDPSNHGLLLFRIIVIAEPSLSHVLLPALISLLWRSMHAIAKYQGVSIHIPLSPTAHRFECKLSDRDTKLRDCISIKIIVQLIREEN